MTLPATRKAGFLAQGAALANYAHQDQSSPMLRGVFVRKRLLCEELPPPPDNVHNTPSDPSPTATTRERLAKHATAPECSGCHQAIDPIGRGFENFDGIGAYRTMESGKAIDASGEIVGVPNGKFTGVPELAAKLASLDQTRACLARQWLRFACGRGEGADDAALLAEVTLHIGKETRLPSLQFGAYCRDTTSFFGVASWYGDGKMAPAESDPYKMFSRLFFGGPGVDTKTADLLRAEKRSILDYALARTKTVQTKVSGADREKLENYYESLRSLEKQLTGSGAGGGWVHDADGRSGDRHQGGRVGAADRSGAVGHGDRGAGVRRDARDHVPDRPRGQQHDAPVAGHHRQPPLRARALQGRGPAAHRRHHKVGQWHAQVFGNLVERLKAIREGAGTMLDNTLVVWVNGMTKGNTHSNYNQPTLLAGTFGGTFKTGRFLRMAKDSANGFKTSYGDLWYEILRAAGMNIESFGDPKFWNGGAPEVRKV